MSGVMMSRYSMALKRNVNGNGNWTITNPLKKYVIQPIMTICGTIIAMLRFMPSIMTSICAGSDIGFGGVSGSPSAFGGFGGLAKYEPSIKILPICCLRDDHAPCGTN